MPCRASPIKPYTKPFDMPAKIDWMNNEIVIPNGTLGPVQSRMGDDFRANINYATYG